MTTIANHHGDGEYRSGQLVRISGRPYRVLKVNATVDGVDGLVLLGALTKARGGAAGEGGGDLLALTSEEIDEHQAAAVAKGRTVRVGCKAIDSEGQSPIGEGQSLPAGKEGQSPTEDVGISVLALLIFVTFVITVTLLLR